MPRLEDLPELLTYGQVAAQLGVSESKVKRLTYSGDLPAVNVGVGSRRVRRDDLAAYIDALAPRSA